MSLLFLINNFHFALELIGAVALLMAAWLTFDTYTFRKDALTLTRAVGLGLCALWETIYALNSGNDILSYGGFLLFLLGLVLVMVSFFKKDELHMQAIIVVPAFSLWSGYLHGAAAALLAAVAYFSYRISKKEMNKTWNSFSLAFLLFAVAELLGIVFPDNQATFFLALRYVAEGAAFVLLVRWVWQFLQLRIRESLVLIFISAALILSTVVTLAFSTILVNQIVSETETNLVTDARVLDLSIGGLKEEALAKTALIARNDTLAIAVAANDFPQLERISETFLETYNLGFVTITGKDGEVLVRAHALSRRGDSLSGERALEEALHGTPFVTVETSPVENLSIRAGAPIQKGGSIIGTVIAGYPLDNALVDNIKRITGLEMFIYSADTSVAGTALATDGRTRITGIPLSDKAVKKTVLEEGKTGTAQVSFFGQPFRASYLPLKNGDDKIIGMISAAKPEQDILDIANATNRLTLITVMLIMLFLSWPIYLFTKRLTENT